MTEVRKDNEPVDLSDLAGALLAQLRGEANAQDVLDAADRCLTPQQRQERDERELRERTATREFWTRNSLSRLPKKLSGLVMSDAANANAPAAKAAIDWATKDGKRVLLIRGGVGVGKTVAAAMAAKAVASLARTTASISWQRPNDFVSGMLHTYDANAPMIGRDLAIIDDVGRETKVDFCEALCSAIDDEDMRLVITTNLTKDQFRERYDVRLIDRLKEVGRALDVKGESRRNRSEDF